MIEPQCFILYIILYDVLPADIFQNQLFGKLFQEYHQSGKQFGSSSGPTFCRALCGSRLFAKVTSRQHLVGKELTCSIPCIFNLTKSNVDPDQMDSPEAC